MCVTLTFLYLWRRSDQPDAVQEMTIESDCDALPRAHTTAKLPGLERKRSSLFLATCCCFLLLSLTRHDLAKHHHSVSIHEGNARQALAILECVAHERLLWLEAALRHLVRLQSVRIFHLLPASLLAHLPLELRNAASRATAPHKADWRITDLDLIGNVQDLDLRIELAGLPERGVLLVHHHIAGARHVVFVQALDVQAHIVSWVCKVDARVVHLDRED